MTNINSEILQSMNIKLYSLRKPSLIKNASSENLYSDVLRSFPFFIFVGEDRYNKEWVFNLVGYLKYISYPCGWYGKVSVNAESTLTICPASIKVLPDNSAPDIPVYPGESGKRNLWSVVKKYVQEVEKLGIVRTRVEKPCFIIESPEKCKWIFNLAGFFDYNDIPFSWNKDDSDGKTIHIGFDTDDFADRKIVITGNGELEQKKQVFNELLGRGFLETENGRIKLGKYFTENGNKENSPE